MCSPAFAVVSSESRCTCGDGSYHHYEYVAFWDYCPLCEADDCLIYNPKGADGGEWTCSVCGADYCAQCGWDKSYSPRARLSFYVPEPEPEPEPVVQPEPTPREKFLIQFKIAATQPILR